MKKILASAVVLTGLATGAAFAQTSFGDVDTDGNGELSFAELQGTWPDLGEAEFTGADADGSGGLTAAELGSLQAGGTSSAPAPASDAGAVPSVEDAPAALN